MSEFSETMRAAFGSDIVMVNGWGFISNLLPIDLESDRTPLPEGVERQVAKVFANLDVLLGTARLTRVARERKPTLPNCGHARWWFSASKPAATRAQQRWWPSRRPARRVFPI